MTELMRASRELFSRTPDETFESFDQLYQYCSTLHERSVDLWEPPESVTPTVLDNGQMGLSVGSSGQLQMNDWSFGQICNLARVDKATLNRLSSTTAMQAFQETFPKGRKPLQILTTDDRVRAVHGASYTRLYNTELLDVVRQQASDFTPPQKGFNGATGLYAGEQDMFCFLIDPTGWVDIGGESFAPGFFIWNSEVGRRTVGIETFWFQSICANHIVWDAMEVTTFSRKHTANVHDALPETRGVSLDGHVVVKEGLDEAMRFRVLAHELAHELLHRDIVGDEVIKNHKLIETEAEAVAFVVCKAHGVDTQALSSEYIQLHRGDNKLLMASLDRIQQTATRIIGLIEDDKNAPIDIDSSCRAQGQHQTVVQSG